jgi:hypothetical protein
MLHLVLPVLLLANIFRKGIGDGLVIVAVYCVDDPLIISFEKDLVSETTANISNLFKARDF